VSHASSVSSALASYNRPRRAWHAETGISGAGLVGTSR
jgi:hypothetical protein